MGAGVDHSLVLRHLDQPLGEVEHLARLHPRLHRGRERRPAVTARFRLVPNDPLRRRHPPQRVPFMPRLPAARLARSPAKAAGDPRLLPQPIARRRLGAGRTVLTQPPAKLGVLRPKRRVLRPQPFVLGPQGLVLAPKLGNLRPKRRNLAPKRSDQLANRGRRRHPRPDSCFAPIRLAKSDPTRQFQRRRDNSDSPCLGVTL